MKFIVSQGFCCSPHKSTHISKELFSLRGFERAKDLLELDFNVFLVVDHTLRNGHKSSSVVIPFDVSPRAPKSYILMLLFFPFMTSDYMEQVQNRISRPLDTEILCLGGEAYGRTGWFQGMQP